MNCQGNYYIKNNFALCNDRQYPSIKKINFGINFHCFIVSLFRKALLRLLHKHRQVALSESDQRD